MKIRVRRWIETLRSSYWFIPLLFCGAAVFLATVLTSVDLRITPTFDGLEWLRPAQPSGARALLSTIAGSTITVAGVAFSVTLVALATAAGTFGPRLLSLFLTDRGVQTSLGVFCGTFLYCLLVLRLVGSAAEGGEDFVPQAAVLGALVLAVFTLGVFIYFVHHIAQSMLVDNVISRTAARLERALADLPEGDVESMTRPPLPDSEGGSVIESERPGYVLPPERGQLVERAQALGVVVEVLRPVGAFVGMGIPLARVHGATRNAEELSELRESMPISHRRRAIEDPDFYIDQLVQIAARSLSPGVNDPFTAVTCIQALEGVLSAHSEPLAPWLGRTDSEGELRLLWQRATWVDRYQTTLGAIRPYAQADPIARRHLIRALERLDQGAEGVSDEHVLRGDLDVLNRHASQGAGGAG